MSRIGRMAEAARGMRAMKQARERERWPRERLRAHQSAALDALVRDVVARSPFYRERFAGLVGSGPVELAALPTVDKATLMANLDDALCAPPLRGRDLRAHVLDEARLLGEFRVLASSGSTGAPSLYVYSRADWTGILAMFFRMNEMSGIRPGIPRTRIAAIGAPSLASMTRRLSLGVDFGLHRLLRLATTDPLDEMVDALNEFRPDVLAAYPSIAALLADEQRVGRLRIAPRIVSTSSELRTPEATARIEDAFGVKPFDLYASTEGLWASDCEHRHKHLFEDWCIAENVDRDGRPVPDGQPGERVLITNLFNRTLPMIRFEVSDVVVIDREPCACGRTLARLHAVEGRSADVLRLDSAAGARVAIHPTQLSPICADPAVREFQIVQRGQRIVLRFALRQGAGEEATAHLVTAVEERLRAAGVAEPDVAAEVVPALERTPAGKLQLVVIDEEQRIPA
jgi:phenylacetate-coenzyme A ligase PaaK-like adenylate-forming protein